jgi:hypothetical protein
MEMTPMKLRSRTLIEKTPSHWVYEETYERCPEADATMFARVGGFAAKRQVWTEPGRESICQQPK